MSREGYELTGQKIQGYTISKPIGQGKFSIVYRAENEQGITFALKKIKIFDMADQKQREKCLKEVDLMKPLNHQNIIKYIDSFIHNSELIIVTEWAEKGDLKKLIKERESQDLPFDERTIWEYMKEISSALKHMHEKRIMHRDLKPANIFISSGNVLKIGDLGLGRSFSSGTLEAFSKVGTPLYMSPELIQDSGYTENADVWSLGCIIYELAELKSPFRNHGEKMSLMELFQNITKCNYIPISANKYSSQLSQAIRNMIVVDPSKRWSSEQTYNEAMKYLEGNKKPMIDSIIAMDDIHVKLDLLNYGLYFCKVAERIPIHRMYFAMEDRSCPSGDQLFYFLELSYWLMALSKPDKKKQKLAIYTKTLIDWRSPTEACSKFLLDLVGFGIKVEDISVPHILTGYGQAVCYLLNEVLNRELIRINFQFKKPVSIEDDLNRNHSPEKNMSSEDEKSEKALSEQSLQEESQFEQSIFFNNKNRKDKNIDGALLERIEQFANEEDHGIIYGKVNEHEWKTECLRLEKKFIQISSFAKEARKKSGYSHIETSKICSAKLTDSLRFVHPATLSLFKTVDQELETIKKGEEQIQQSFKQFGKQYSCKNQETIQLKNKSFLLQKYLFDNHSLLEKIETRLLECRSRVEGVADAPVDNKSALMRKTINELEQEVKHMNERRQIMLWQIRKYQLQERKDKNHSKEDYREAQHFDHL